MAQPAHLGRQEVRPPSLLDEFAGKVNLIYIDPPFDTGADFSYTATIPIILTSMEIMAQPSDKEPSVIEQKAYRDTWGRGLDGYLKWFYETVLLARELLAENGSLYVHFDSHVAHYAKLVLDDVFGVDNFLNELIWQRTSAHSDTHRYGMNFDNILFYSKATTFTWDVLYHKYTERQKAKYRSDSTGRLFADFDLRR